MQQPSHLLISQEPPFTVPDRKPAAHLLGADVGSVLHDDVLLDAADQTPELFFHQLCGDHLGARGRNNEIPKPYFNSEKPESNTFRL